MSQTLADAERRVRYHLRDRNPQGQAFTSPEVVHEIESALRIVASRLLLGDERVLSIVTTTAHTQFYMLPGAQVYSDIQHFKEQSNGWPVPVVSVEKFESNMRGQSSLHPAEGIPLMAMLLESADQVLQVGFWPVPDRAWVFDAYRSLLPERFFTAGTGVLAASPDATDIPFDDQGFEALCYVTAADLFNRMPEDDRARLKLADTSSTDWNAKAADLISNARKRRIYQLLSTGGNRRGRRW